jgi:acyl-CoA thioester hydrolase
MEGYHFSVDLRVRFSETDAQGIANNAVYLNWFEVARVTYLARFPGGYRGLIEQGVEALTVEANVRYLAPCGFDDELRIHTRVTRLRGARFHFEYVVERLGEPPATIAEGWTGHACVDAKTFRPTRMPAWLAEGIREVEKG